MTNKTDTEPKPSIGFDYIKAINLLTPEEINKAINTIRGSNNDHINLPTKWYNISKTNLCVQTFQHPEKKQLYAICVSSMNNDKNLLNRKKKSSIKKSKSICKLNEEDQENINLNAKKDVTNKSKSSNYNSSSNISYSDVDEYGGKKGSKKKSKKKTDTKRDHGKKTTKKTTKKTRSRSKSKSKKGQICN